MIDFTHAVWQRSRKSQQAGQCVELARLDGVVGVRDSKDPRGPILVFAAADMSAFLDGVIKGKFDIVQ
jgi:hypothetical protein